MPLMKENKVDRIQHEAIVLDLGDLRRQADELKRRAQARVDEMIADAEAEAARLTTDASQQGYQAGYEKGMAEGLAAGRQEGHAEALANAQEQLAAFDAAWMAAGQQWDAGRRQMLIEARQSLLALAIAIAQKVVKRVPLVDPSVVVDQVYAAIEHVARPGDVTIRINPEDRGIVTEAIPGFVASCVTAEHIALVDDATIARGGCVITTGRGRIDATLDKQLDRLVAALLPTRDKSVSASDEERSE